MFYLAALNLAAKAALIGLLVYGALRPDLPQFEGKAMSARLFTFGLSAVILPAVWLIVRPKRQAWIPWVVAFGLLLITYAPPIPPWAVFGLVLGFGAVTHILWELAEHVTFIRGGPEEDTAYTDTLGDLTLSLSGSVVGALIVSAVAASRSRAAASRGRRERRVAGGG